MNVVHHCLDVRECRAVRNRPAIPVEAALPAGIEVDIDEAVVLQARGFERVGLRDHVRLRQKVALDGLLAEAAPAKIGFLAGVVDLCARAGQESFLWSVSSVRPTMQPYVAMKGSPDLSDKNDALGLRGGWHPDKRHLSSSCKDSHASAMGRGAGERS